MACAVCRVCAECVQGVQDVQGVQGVHGTCKARAWPAGERKPALSPEIVPRCCPIRLKMIISSSVELLT